MQQPLLNSVMTLTLYIQANLKMMTAIRLMFFFLLMDIRIKTVMQQSKQQRLHLSQPILFSN